FSSACSLPPPAWRQAARRRAASLPSASAEPSVFSAEASETVRVAECAVLARRPLRCLRVTGPRGRQGLKIEDIAVEQVRGAHAPQTLHHGLHAAGVAAFPLAEHALHLPALHVLLRAAQVARDDRKLP